MIPGNPVPSQKLIGETSCNCPVPSRIIVTPIAPIAPVLPTPMHSCEHHRMEVYYKEVPELCAEIDLSKAMLSSISVRIHFSAFAYCIHVYISVQTHFNAFTYCIVSFKRYRSFPPLTDWSQWGRVTLLKGDACFH